MNENKQNGTFVFPSEFISTSPSQTEDIAGGLAKAMLENSTIPRFVALYGDLGVGKTAFVRGFTSVICPSARVKSPTFALVNEYKGEKLSVFHFDMYRITDDDELYSIGYYDYPDRNGICLTEWSENIGYALPDSYIRVEIQKTDNSGNDPDTRRIFITSV